MSKLLFVTTSHPNYDQRLIRFCTFLNDEGHEVTWWSRPKHGSPNPTIRDFSVGKVNCFFQGGKMFYLEFNLRVFIKLLFSKGFDKVTAIDMDSLPAIYLTSFLKKFELIFDAHEYFSQVPEVVSRKPIQKIWESLEDILIPKVDKAITVGPMLADMFSKKWGVHFETIRNIPSVSALITKVTKEKQPYLIYQGALNKGRGLEMLLEAMAEIDFHLKIVGEGDLSDFLRELAEDLKISNKVEFMGFKKPNELREITMQAYAGINVSENLGLSYFYSLNNKCFDYMHAGIPTISNDFPEYRKLNEQFEIAILVPPVKAELVEGINKLINDKEIYFKLVAECMKAREIINWQNESKKLRVIYP
jgi:glycosyltransferase involved in cell wall biosynthesis